MLTSIINQPHLFKVQQSPEEYHWSQSQFERVKSAKVLEADEYHVLTETNYLAPKLVRRSTCRTDHAGKIHLRIAQMLGSVNFFEDYQRNLREVQEAINTNYENGDFPHTDYTLWLVKPNTRAFVNLRVFPEGSYLVDLINAEVEMFDGNGKRIGRIGSTDSYLSYRDDLDDLNPEGRTLTLDQLAKRNRLRDGSINLDTPQGTYSGVMEKGDEHIIFTNPDDPLPLNFFMLDEENRSRINQADLSEQSIQNVLVYFKNLLDKHWIPYRQENTQILPS